MKLGYGLVAFRKMLRSLTVLFFVLSIIMVPCIIIYSHGQGESDQFFPRSSKFMLTLGNMGYDSVKCEFVPYEIGAI